MRMRKENEAEYQDRSTYNPLFPLFIYYDPLRPSEYIGLHWHDEIELITVLDGRVALQYEGQTIILKKNDIAFVNSSCVHGYRAAPHSEVVPLVRPLLISPSLLSSNGYDIIQSKYITPMLAGEMNIPVVFESDDPTTVLIKKMLDDIAELFKQETYGYEMKIKAYLYDMIFHLLLPYKSKWEERNHGIVSNKTDLERFKKSLNYIYEHYSEKIRVCDIADYMHMSEGHFSRFFKRMAQKTPIEYINEYKISKAARMLRETDKKEIEIALDVGFENFSYFISIFKKKIHCTPSQYRKRECS